MDNLEKTINNIKNELTNINDFVNSKLRNSYDEGYNAGLKTGYEEVITTLKNDNNIPEIDMTSIKIFASWCYVNGIDFSYMAKATDTEHYTNKVIRNFINSFQKFYTYTNDI